MKGLDTNVILRLLTRDDATQYQQARAYVERNCTTESPGFINQIVLIEVIWTLKSGYHYERQEIAHAIDVLLHAANFVVDAAVSAEAALEEYKKGADFADAFIAATNVAAGCRATASFDSRAARSLDNFEFIS